MTSHSRLRFASPAAALAIAGFVATGISGTTLASIAQADASAPLVAQQRVHATFTADAKLPVFGNAQPQQQQIFDTAPQREDVAQIAQSDIRTAAYYNQIRAQLHWVPVRMGNEQLKTPDPMSRIVLAQAAAQRAGLSQVGLSYKEVYGIINAETSWIPRMGSSKDGTPNLGIAQFEPATAKALGLKNPQDPVEAVHVMAEHLKEAAVWSSRKLSGLKLSPAAYTAKLREGISVYYNLSTKGRAQWNGMNTAKLPIETQRHISNAARGAREAGELANELRRGGLQASNVLTGISS